MVKSKEKQMHRNCSKEQALTLPEKFYLDPWCERECNPDLYPQTLPF